VMGYSKNRPFVKVDVTGEVDKRFDEVSSQLADNVTKLEGVTKNPVNYNGAIVTIIDDDMRVECRTVWNPVLLDTGVKISFAAISGNVGTPDYMNIGELHTYQDQGHEILSQTVTHEATADITPGRADPDYKNSQQWLKDNGFKGYDTLIYPGGMHTNNIPIKNVARKYYKYAVATNIGGEYNLAPFDNWRVPRIQGDTGTLQQLKTAVDNAILNNGWVVLMTHSHVLLTAGSQKMRDFIAYVQSLNVPIMPFGEASKIKGNAVAIGEFTDDDSTFVGVNGSSKIGGSLTIRTTQNGVMDAPITDYKANAKNVQILTSVADTFMSTGGVYEVFRGDSDLYSYATFTPYNSNRVFMRKWNLYTGVWKSFEDIASPSAPAYTTGFWTPKLEGSTTAGTNTYTTQYGSWTKIANMVTARFNIRITAAQLDTLMAGNLRVTGLPFPTNATAQVKAIIEYNILNLGTNFYNVFVSTVGGQSYLDIFKSGSGVSTNYVKATAIPSSQTILFEGQITYQVA